MTTRVAMFRGRAVLVLAATVVGIALTARLGAWQLDRAARKVALERSIDERSALPPLNERDLATTDGGVAEQLHRRITLHGRWLPNATVYLDNRQMQGRPGFYVVTPLVLTTGSARVVVVQRGWIPVDIAQRHRLAPVDTPAGEVRVDGRIAPPPARLFEPGTPASGAIRQNLDLPAYAAELGVLLPPLSVVQENGPRDGLSRHWPRPAVDVHKHYGYAFQWFALCALIAGLYVWFQLIRPRRHRSA